MCVPVGFSDKVFIYTAELHFYEDGGTLVGFNIIPSFDSVIQFPDFLACAHLFPFAFDDLLDERLIFLQRLGILSLKFFALFFELVTVLVQF